MISNLCPVGAPVSDELAADDDVVVAGGGPAGVRLRDDIVVPVPGAAGCAALTVPAAADVLPVMTQPTGPSQPAAAGTTFAVVTRPSA